MMVIPYYSSLVMNFQCRVLSAIWGIEKTLPHPSLILPLWQIHLICYFWCIQKSISYVNEYLFQVLNNQNHYRWSKDLRLKIKNWKWSVICGFFMTEIFWEINGPIGRAGLPVDSVSGYWAIEMTNNDSWVDKMVTHTTTIQSLTRSSTLTMMMTSSNGNVFPVTGHLCGEFTGHRWIPRTKASDAELWSFLWSTPE